MMMDYKDGAQQVSCKNIVFPFYENHLFQVRQVYCKSINIFSFYENHLLRCASEEESWESWISDLEM